MTPRIIILPLMYVCDARCVMCNIWKVKADRGWQVSDLSKVLADPSLAKNVEVVNITGGEPTMRPDLVEVVDTIIENLQALHTLSIQTNGMSPERLARRLEAVAELLRQWDAEGRRIHLDINISCDGPNAVHDIVRGVPGAWRSLVESVSVAKRVVRGLPQGAVTLNLTIVRQNARHLRAAEAAARELDVPMTFTFPQATDVYVANTDSTDQFALSELEVAEVVAFLRELLPRLSGRSAMSRRYCAMLIDLLTGGTRELGCPLSDGGLFLEPGGRSLPCWRSEELVAGNVLDDGVEAVIARRRDAGYRAMLQTHCRTCPSNCYVDWGRRMFARSATTEAVSP